MSVLKLSDVVLFGIDVLKTTVNAVTKTITAQIGDVVSQTVTSQDAEWWQHVGFASRPPAPSAGVSACQTVAIRRSDREACIASRDLRGLALYGSLGDGETCIYGAGHDGKSQGRALFKDNGSVTLYTAQGNIAGGPSVTVQLNATDGSIAAANQYGAMSLGPSGFQIAMKGGAGFMLDLSGNVTLIGGTGGGAAINAASVSLGANAVLPVVWGPLGISGVGSTSVKVAI